MASVVFGVLVTSCGAGPADAPPAAQFCTSKPVFEPLPLLTHRVHFDWLGYETEEAMRASPVFNPEQNQRHYYEPVDQSLFPDAPPYARMLRASPEQLDPAEVVNVAVQGGFAYGASPPYDSGAELLRSPITPLRPDGEIGEWVLRISRPESEHTDCRLHDFHMQGLEAAMLPPEEKARRQIRGPAYNYFTFEEIWSRLGANYADSLAVMQEQRDAGRCLRAEWIRWDDMPLKAYRLSWNDPDFAPGVEYGHSPRYIFFEGRIVFFDAAVIRGTASRESTKGDPLFDSCCISGPPLNRCSIHGEDDPLAAMGNKYNYLLNKGR